MRLGNNLMANNIMKNYKVNIRANSKSMEKISSGKNINGAKDSPIKIGKYDTMKSRLRSLESAAKNVQDSISFIQVADSALGEIDSALNRMNELTVQASTDLLNENDKENIRLEIESLKEHIDAIAETTKFNGIKVIGNEYVANNKYPYNTSVQIGSEEGEVMNLPMFNFTLSALKDEDGKKLADISSDTINDCKEAIKTINDCKDAVSKARGKYGALQNVLENTYESIESTSLNVTETVSNIGDADIALNMIELSKTQLLNDTSLLLLKQTNEFPTQVLNILGNMK